MKFYDEEVGVFFTESSNLLGNIVRRQGDSNSNPLNIYDPSNPYVDNGTSCVHAEKILSQGLVPGATRIETEMLVEASCHHCELFVTFSDPLLKAPPMPLNLALIENDMEAVTVAIASPKMIAERLKLIEK